MNEQTRNPEKRLLRAEEVADILSVPVSTVYEAARAGRIDGVVRLGRNVRFDAAKLEEWIANGGQALPGGWRREPEAVPA